VVLSYTRREGILGRIPTRERIFMTVFLLVFIICYFWHGMGTTIGYHRLLAHRSFKCSKIAEYFWVLGGYLSFEGSPIWWAAIHRAHHRYVDMPGDPHSPRISGIWYSWFGWLFDKGYPAHIDAVKQCPDLITDPVYRFLEQDFNVTRAHWLVFFINSSTRLLLWALFGWQVALGSLLAGLAVLQVPLFLNVFCHMPKLGYKNFAADDDSVNVWWVALLAHGEGWHNNHHAFPGSARTGILAHEIDISWMAIKFMKAVGLVSYMNEDVTRKPPIELESRAKAEDDLAEVA
jgi:sn-1 stearoyl-lipid 9-desaturase